VAAMQGAHRRDERHALTSLSEGVQGAAKRDDCADNFETGCHKFETLSSNCRKSRLGASSGDEHRKPIMD
jgi:hypothetical protein